MISIYQDRIRTLVETFSETVEQLELSRTLEQMNSPDLVKYRIEYIGEIIKASLYNEKEKYIQRLLQEIQDLRGTSGSQRILDMELQHQKQMESLRKELEQKQEKPLLVDNEVRSLIQLKMQELEKDYILKVIHDQEMKTLDMKLTGGKQAQYENAIVELRCQNELLRSEMEIIRMEGGKRYLVQRSPVNELQGLCNDNLQTTVKNPPVQVLSTTQPTGNVTSVYLNKCQSVESFSALKDTFQKELGQLRETLKAKYSKIVKGKQHLVLSRDMNSPSDRRGVEPPLRSNSNRASVPSICPNLDTYTFGHYPVSSPTLKRTSRGYQRILNVPRTPNQPESLNHIGSYKSFKQN